MYRTKEYVHRDDNGDVVSSVQVHEVTKDEAGEQITTTGGVVTTLNEGDVMVSAANPNYWDVLPAKVWGESEYVAADDAPAAPTAPDTVRNPDTDSGSAANLTK